MTRRLIYSALTAMLISGCASLPGQVLTSSAGGWHQCAQAGTGAPVVVFETGVGETLTTWNSVYQEVAQVSTAFAYSRRGYDGSSPTFVGRDGKAVVEELRALLSARRLNPPYVLVGHSLGGLYMELFAKLHPDEVAGVVLVDPTPVDHMDRLRVQMPSKYTLVQSMLLLQADSIEAAEQRGINATSREWHAAPSFPDRPMIVLTGVKASFIEDSAMIAYKEKAHTELLTQWMGAEHRRVDSGHFIQRDKPEAVIKAIKDVLVLAGHPVNAN